MKKILYVVFFFLAFQAEAQESVNFKMKYLPSHNYNGTVSMDIKCNITLSGNDTVINKLKQQGITQPIAFNIIMKMNGDTKTGSPAANHIFPLIMNYKIGELSANVNGKAIPMPAQVSSSNIKIYGHVGADGILQADSVNGGKMKDTLQQKISQMMNAFQNRVKFPDHPLHVGDTFTQDMPLNIPMAGNNIAANAKSVYKLVSIAGGKAYFDVTQSMDMSIPIKGSAVSLTGSGSGKMIYDLKNSFPTDYTTNISLNVNGKIETLQINATAIMNMSYNYIIQ